MRRGVDRSEPDHFFAHPRVILPKQLNGLPEATLFVEQPPASAPSRGHGFPVDGIVHRLEAQPAQNRRLGGGEQFGILAAHALPEIDLLEENDYGGGGNQAKPTASPSFASS